MQRNEVRLCLVDYFGGKGERLCYVWQSGNHDLGLLYKGIYK